MTEKAKNRIRDSYGVNMTVCGDYDQSLSARCENGIFVGRKSESICEFRGIPFAKPPVGKLRWKAPEPVESSDIVMQAYYNGKSPIQTEWSSEQASYYPQGEDCLYLNIWKNLDDTTPDKPVMVFIHGGSYGWGGTADPMYDGKNFVSAHPDIILVSIGYRIGLMGFVDLSYFEGGEDYPDAPNLGILDQIEALRWIQRNIRAFGGNPKNVTIFGESAGGGSVSLLPMIPCAKGLFCRVIAESGSVALTFSKEECREFSKKLKHMSGAQSVSQLQRLSEFDLQQINEKLNQYNNFPQRDGKLIPLNPYKPYENGETADVDMLIGTNAEEMNYWIEEVGGMTPYRLLSSIKFENDMKILSASDKKRVRDFMSLKKEDRIWRMSRFYDEMMFRLPAVEQARLHSKNGGKTYMYYWTVPSTLPMHKACHAVELAYVFGNRDETIYTGEPADKSLSDTVMQMWTNFARTGDPSTDSLTWARYSEPERATMVIDRHPYIQNDILRSQRELLSPLLRYMINPSYAMLDYNVPFIRKAVAGGLALTAGLAAVIIFAIKSLSKD